jgi:hypothetical protein
MKVASTAVLCPRKQVENKSRQGTAEISPIITYQEIPMKRSPKMIFDGAQPRDLFCFSIYDRRGRGNGARRFVSIILKQIRWSCPDPRSRSLINTSGARAKEESECLADLPTC